MPEWNLLLIGYVLYTIAIITMRLPSGTLGMVLGMVGLVVASSRIQFAPATPYLGVLLLVAAAGVAGSIDPKTSWDAVIEGSKIWIVALVGYNALRTPRQIRFILLFVLACYALVPVRPTLLGFATGSMKHAGRAIGPFIYSNSNDLAAMTLLMLGVSLCVLAVEASHKVLRLLTLGFTGTLVIIILLTQSRGGFLGLLAMMVPFVLASTKKGVKPILLSVMVLIAAVLTVPSSAWTRLAGIKQLTSVETLDNADPEGSAAERYKLVNTAIRIISDHPVLGVGLKTYAVANARYSPSVGKRDTHNTYLNLGAETGLLGLGAFVLALVAVFRFTSRAKRALARSDPVRATGIGHLQRGLAGFLVAGFFGSYAWLGLLHLYLALICSVAAVWSASAQPVAVPRRNPQRVRGLWEPDFQGRRVS